MEDSHHVKVQILDPEAASKSRLPSIEFVGKRACDHTDLAPVLDIGSGERAAFIQAEVAHPRKISVGPYERHGIRLSAARDSGVKHHHPRGYRDCRGFILDMQEIIFVDFSAARVTV